MLSHALAATRTFILQPTSHFAATPVAGAFETAPSHSARSSSAAVRTIGVSKPRALCIGGASCTQRQSIELSKSTYERVLAAEERLTRVDGGNCLTPAEVLGLDALDHVFVRDSLYRIVDNSSIAKMATCWRWERAQGRGTENELAEPFQEETEVGRRALGPRRCRNAAGWAVSE